MVPVRALFLKSKTHWYFKQTGDISVANHALFSFYYRVPLPDVSQSVSVDVSTTFSKLDGREMFMGLKCYTGAFSVRSC